MHVPARVGRDDRRGRVDERGGRVGQRADARSRRVDGQRHRRTGSRRSPPTCWLWPIWQIREVGEEDALVTDGDRERRTARTRGPPSECPAARPSPCTSLSARPRPLHLIRTGASSEAVLGVVDEVPDWQTIADDVAWRNCACPAGRSTSGSMVTVWGCLGRVDIDEDGQPPPFGEPPRTGGVQEHLVRAARRERVGAAPVRSSTVLRLSASVSGSVNMAYGPQLMTPEPLVHPCGGKYQLKTRPRSPGSALAENVTYCPPSTGPVGPVTVTVGVGGATRRADACVPSGLVKLMVSVTKAVVRGRVLTERGDGEPVAVGLVVDALRRATAHPPSPGNVSTSDWVGADLRWLGRSWTNQPLPLARVTDCRRRGGRAPRSCAAGSTPSLPRR